jgi:hypothetical protein
MRATSQPAPIILGVITHIMKINCPTLNRYEEATLQNIAESIYQLEGKEDPFLILEKNELTYMQTLWTPDGFDLEYQDGNILEHYRVSEFATQDDVIWALQNYLKGEPYWKAKFKFEKKEIATQSYKIGHKIGSLFGKLSRIMSGD